MSSTKATTTPKDETELKRCGCGCTGIINPKREFLPGHDMKRRSALLAHWDAGQGGMAEELVDRGWYSWEELYERRDKRQAKEKVKADRAKAHEAKAEANRKAKEAPTKTATEEVVEPVAKPKRTRLVKARGAQPLQPIA